MAGTNQDIEALIRRRRLTWFGVKKAMKGDFKNKRGRGRLPKRWTDLITTAEKYAQERLKWRRLVNTKWFKAWVG